jgi:hypothetical protein
VGTCSRPLRLILVSNVVLQGGLFSRVCAVIEWSLWLSQKSAVVKKISRPPHDKAHVYDQPQLTCPAVSLCISRIEVQRSLDLREKVQKFFLTYVRSCSS